jgi:hypothetical protein
MSARKEQLQRMILGLESQIPDFESRLQYYAPDDVEFRYAQKFVKSMQDNLEKAKQELAELDKQPD